MKCKNNLLFFFLKSAKICIGSGFMVDMHIHTNNSDGQYSTKQIVEMLKNNNTNMFSITDHDNINSCIELENINLPEWMIYIPGIEFSALNNQYNCHILGYNIDYRNTSLIKECELIKKRRLDKIEIIIKNLENKHNIYLTEEEKKHILTKKGTTGRFEICKVLINRGYGRKTRYI